MSLRVLSDTDRQTKLADGRSNVLAQLEGVSKKFAGASHNALEDIKLEIFQKDFFIMAQCFVMKGLKRED